MARREPFHDFAFKAETPLRQARASICAAHELMGNGLDADPAVRDAIGYLVADVFAKLDHIIDAHSAAYAALQEARSA